MCFHYVPDLKYHLNIEAVPLDTGGKLIVYKTFRRRPGRFLNVSCAISLRPVSRGMYTCKPVETTNDHINYLKFLEFKVASS